MKHFRRLLAMCLAMVMLFGVALGVVAEGVVFSDSFLFDIGRFYYDDSDGLYHIIDASDKQYSILNDWLINTPYWTVDIFAPGYSTKHLLNDPRGNEKTIDFEIIPYEGTKDTVIVADIPEEYRGLYNDFISKEKKEDPYATVRVSNIIKRNGSLILDYHASGRFDLKWNEDIQDYYNFHEVHLYGVTSDKQTGEIIRYDHMKRLGTSYSDGMYYVFDDKYFDLIDGEVKGAEIKLPEDFDPEKHEYGFCFIVFDRFDSDLIYEGDIDMYNYTVIDIPEKDTPKPEPKPTPILKYEYGDANRDGKINITDASMMLKYITGWNIVEIDVKLCDLSGNGRVDLHDVSTTLKIIAGWNV